MQPIVVLKLERCMYTNTSWMADVLNDLIKFSEKNKLTDTDKYLRLARKTLHDGRCGNGGAMRPTLNDSVGADSKSR